VHAPLIDRFDVTCRRAGIMIVRIRHLYGNSKKRPFVVNLELLLLLRHPIATRPYAGSIDIENGHRSARFEEPAGNAFTDAACPPVTIATLLSSPIHSARVRRASAGVKLDTPFVAGFFTCVALADIRQRRSRARVAEDGKGTQAPTMDKTNYHRGETGCGGGRDLVCEWGPSGRQP